MSTSTATQKSPENTALPAYWQSNVPLCDYTTLKIGGPARYMACCDSTEQLVETLNIARTQSLPVFVLGEGSNILISDQGFDGVVIRNTDRRVEAVHEDVESMTLQVSAGMHWDNFVALIVQQGLGGIECLSGIPGTVGAAPIQNIWAYGQDVGSVIVSVGVIDRDAENPEPKQIAGEECDFHYRTSRFKTEWHNLIVTDVTFRLPKTTKGTVRYSECRWLLPIGEQEGNASVNSVRQAILD
ncbi:MAG: FAD-binding protein, partial [Gammaproteobacteria bacterium]|nr:FAD-binding protein [Gammaproteobacteria bacterium]